MNSERQPTPDAIQTVQDQLRPHLSNPDRYWPILVEHLVLAAEHLDAVHGQDCTTATGCRTCQALAELSAAVDAHDLIQPSGCACPDHCTYPATTTVVGAAA